MNRVLGINKPGEVLGEKVNRPAAEITLQKDQLTIACAVRKCTEWLGGMRFYLWVSGWHETEHIENACRGE